MANTGAFALYNCSPCCVIIVCIAATSVVKLPLRFSSLVSLEAICQTSADFLTVDRALFSVKRGQRFR